MRYLYVLLLLLLLNATSLISASVDLNTLKVTEDSNAGVWSIKNSSWSFWSTNRYFSKKLSHLNSLQAIQPGVGYFVVGEDLASHKDEIRASLPKASVKIQKPGWAFVNLANPKEVSFKDTDLLHVEKAAYYVESSKEWVEWNQELSTNFIIPAYASFWVKTNSAGVQLNQEASTLFTILGDVNQKTTNLKPQLNYQLESDLVEPLSNNIYVLNKQQAQDGYYINLNSFQSEGVFIESLIVEETRVSHGVSNTKKVFSKSNFRSAFANERVFVNPDYDEYLEYKVSAKVLNSDVTVERFAVRIKDQRLTPLKNLFNNLKRSAKSRSSREISANDIDIIELSVSGEGISPSQVQTYPANTVEAQISIIAGPQRTFLVRYFDQFGDVMKQASTTIDVLNTMSTPIRLESKDLGFAPIVLSHPAGEYSDAIDLVMSISSGKLFYTLDGTNPKLEVANRFETTSVTIPMNVSTNLRVFIEDADGVKSGVFSYVYELGGSPTVTSDVLTESYLDEYESPVQLSFNSNFANTKVFYSINGSEVTTASDFGIAPFTIVLTDVSDILFFGESSLGYRSDVSSRTINLLPSEYSLTPEVNLNIEGDFFNGKYVWPVDLNFSSNLPETKVYYSVDSSPVSSLSTFQVTPFTISLENDTDLQFFGQSVVNNLSEVESSQFIGYADGEINPNVAIAFSNVGVSGHYSFPVTATFTGIPGTDLYYTLDGTTPTVSSEKVSVPYDLVINKDTHVKWFGSVSDTVVSSVQGIQVQELPISFYEGRNIDVSATGHRTYSGSIFGPETLTLLIDGQDQSQLIQYTQEHTKYTYEIDSSNINQKIDLIISNEEGVELAKIEEEIISPSLNHILGGAMFGLPSQYFSLDAIGGYGSSTFDYHTQEKVFYNSISGALFKVDSQGVTSLIANLEEVASIIQLQDFLENVDTRDPNIGETLQKYNELSGSIAAHDSEYVFNSVEFLKTPVNTGQDTKAFGTKIYRYNNLGLESIAGYDPETSVAQFFLKDLIGTSASYVATHTYLGDEIHRITHLEGSVLFIAHSSIFEISPTGFINWVGGASFDTTLSDTFTGVQSQKWDMKGFEKTSPNSIMVSAIVSDDTVPLANGIPQYRPAKIYEFSKLNTGQFSLIEKYTIGNKLVGVDYVKNNVPAEQIPASFYIDGRYQDLIKTFGFVNEKIYFTLIDSEVMNGSSDQVPTHVYSLDPTSLNVTLELDPRNGITSEASSPLDQLKQSPRKMITMGNELLFVYQRENYDFNPRDSTSLAIPIVPSIDDLMNNSTETELALFNPITNSVAYFMDGEGEMSLDPDSTFVYTETESYIVVNHEEGGPNGSQVVSELIKKPHYVSFDEDTPGGVLRIPDGSQIEEIALFHNDEPPVVIISQLQDTYLSWMNVEGQQQTLLSSSPQSFMERFPNASASLTTIATQANGLGAYDTLEFAVQNGLTISEIPLPSAEFLSLHTDKSSQSVFLLVKALQYAKLYEIDMSSKVVELTLDFSEVFNTLDGDVAFQVNEISIQEIVNSQIIFTHLGGVYQFSTDNSQKSILYVNSALDANNAQLASEKSGDLSITDLKFSWNDQMTPYMLFDYPIIDGKHISGISKGVPKSSNILFSFARGQQQMSSIQNRASFDQKTIHQLSQETWAELPDEHKSLLSNVSNYVAISFGEVKLLNAPSGVFLQANGLIDTKLIALDIRPASNDEISVTNLSNSGGVDVSAKDQLSFTYTTTGAPIDLFATIGSELINYNNGLGMLPIDSFVGSFSGDLLKGAVGIDLFGRKTEVFGGLASSLTYNQSIVDFVPLTSEISITTDLQEPVEFQNYMDFSVESTPFSTNVIVTLLSNNEVVFVSEHRMDSYDDKSQTHVGINLANNVDQVVVEVVNPNGASGNPIVYNLVIKKFSTIAGAFGKGYGSDHTVVDSLRRLKQSVSNTYPDLLSERSMSEQDLRSADLFHIDQNNTLRGDEFFATFLDHNNERAFEKVISYTDIVNSPIGKLAIDSILNSETSSYETLIEYETEIYGSFEDIHVMEAITKIDGEYDFITFANGYFYLLGKTLLSQNVMIKTSDFADFAPSFFVDNSGLVVGSINNFINFDADTNFMYIGIQSSQTAHLFRLDVEEANTEPVIVFTQDLSLNSSQAYFDDSNPKYLNGSNLYGFFAAYSQDGKLFVGLNSSNMQLGGPIVEIQSTPFVNQDPDVSSGSNKGYFVPFIGSPQYQYYSRYTPRLLADRYSNGTKSIVKQNNSLYRLDLADNFVEIKDGRQTPIIVSQEQNHDVVSGLIKGYDPYDFREEVFEIAPNYSRLEDGLFVGLENRKLAYYSFPQMKIFRCDDFGQYQEIKANASEHETLISNRSRNIYHVDLADSDTLCKYSLKYSVPQSIVGTNSFRFTQISSNELYIAQKDEITYWNTDTNEQTVVKDAADGADIQSMLSHNGVIYLIIGDQNSGELFIFDPDTKQENYISSGVSQQYIHGNKVYFKQYSQVKSIDPFTRNVVDVVNFGNGEGIFGYKQQSVLSDMAYHQVRFVAPGANKPVRYSAHFYEKGSQIKIIHEDQFVSPSISDATASHNGSSSTLVNGDKVTFVVNMDSDIPVALNARFNGKKLNFVRSSQTSYEAEYEVEYDSLSTSTPVSVVGLRAINRFGNTSSSMNVSVDNLSAISPTYILASDLVLRAASYTKTQTNTYDLAYSVENTTNTTVNKAMIRFKSNGHTYQTTMDLVIEPHTTLSFVYNLNPSVVFPGINNYQPSTDGLRSGIVPQLGNTFKYRDRRPLDNYLVVGKTFGTFVGFNDVSQVLVVPFPEIMESTTYFVARNPDQGPTQGEWSSDTTSAVLTVRAVNSSGVETDVILRGLRDAVSVAGNGTKRVMNSAQVLVNSNSEPFYNQSLILKFDINDNLGLVPGETYESTMDLVIDAKYWHLNNTLRDTVFVNVDITIPQQP